MIDTISRRRPGFRSGRSIHLADAQEWTVPEPNALIDSGSIYDALIEGVASADSRPEILRAELALGIHLISLNYDLSPLILGALLDFPEEDPALAQLQSELHEVAVEHVRAHRPASDDSIAPRATLRVMPRLGFFHRARAAASA